MSNYPGALSGGFVSHRFVSLKADQPDLSVINASNWNQSHIIGSGAIQSGALGGAVVGSGNLISGAVIVGSVASGAIQSGAMGAGAIVGPNLSSGYKVATITQSGPQDGGDYGPGTPGTVSFGLAEAIQSGGYTKIFIKNGNYAMSGPALPVSGLDIGGESQGGVVITLQGSNVFLSGASAVSNIYLHDFTLNSNSTNPDLHIPNLTANHVIYERITIISGIPVFQPVTPSGSWLMIDKCFITTVASTQIVGLTNGFITNSFFYNGSTSGTTNSQLQLNHSRRVVIGNCIFFTDTNNNIDADIDCGYTQDLTIENCQFIASGTQTNYEAIHHELSVSGTNVPNNTVITGNNIVGHTNGIHVYLVPGTTPATPTGLIISQNTIKNFGAGVLIDYANDFSVVDNIIPSLASGTGISVRGQYGKVGGNIISCSPAQYQPAISVVGGSNYVDVERNQILVGATVSPNFGIKEFLNVGVNLSGVLPQQSANNTYRYNTLYATSGPSTVLLGTDQPTSSYFPNTDIIADNVGFNPFGWVNHFLDVVNNFITPSSGTSATPVSGSTYTAKLMAGKLYVSSGGGVALSINGHSVNYNPQGMVVPFEIGDTVSFGTFTSAPTLTCFFN